LRRTLAENEPAEYGDLPGAVQRLRRARRLRLGPLGDGAGARGSRQSRNIIPGPAEGCSVAPPVRDRRYVYPASSLRAARAGGDSFISFPIRLFIGVPPVEANATNTVTLWPGLATSVSLHKIATHVGRVAARPPVAGAQVGNLRLAMRVIGDLKRLADLQRRQFFGVFAPLGRFGQRLPWTINHVLIADAERITAERIDSVAVFALDPPLGQKLKPRPSGKRGGRGFDAIFL